MLTAADKALGPNRAWQVVGSVGTQYTVIEWKATRFWSCNCPNWWAKRQKLDGHSINSPREHHCKHILEVIETPSMMAKGVTQIGTETSKVRALMNGPMGAFTSKLTTDRAISLDDEEV